jgi:hypothetical protein
MKIYPNLGAALADKILDDAEYADMNSLEQFTQDQIEKVKIAMRELDLNLANAIRERNVKINQIQLLPEGEFKSAMIKEFNSIDKGGWFSPSFVSQVNAVKSIMNKLGVDHSLPEMQTMGLLPLAAIPTAGWVAAVASIAVIGSLATYFLTQAARYTALVINPEIYDPSATTAFADSLGGGAKYALIIAAIGGVAFFLMKDKAIK